MGASRDDAVRAFEKVVAPSNYKRPTALVTPRMVDAARERLTVLRLDWCSATTATRCPGYRAVAANALFVYRPTFRSKGSGDVFDQLKEGTVVNPKTLSKVDEVVDRRVHHRRPAEGYGKSGSG